MLHRFPKGLAGDKVHQKRLPAGAPPWVETVRLHFPRWNRTADELCVTELGSVIWAVQMSTVEFHPWNSRRAGHREARRVADRPRPRARCRDYAQVRRVAHVAHEVLDELGAVGYPKTSGEQGPARLRPDPARPRLQGRTPGRARVRPRGRAARPRRRHHRRGGARTATRTTCSSTTTRTPATTPSPRRTPSAASPTPGSPRRSAGTRSTTRPARLHDLHRPGAVRRARRPARGHRRPRLRHRPAAGVGRPRRRRAVRPRHPADPDDDTRIRVAVGIQITPSILNADFAALGRRGGADPQRRLGARRRDGQPLRPEPDLRPDDGRGAGRGRPTSRSTRT